MKNLIIYLIILLFFFVAVLKTFAIKPKDLGVKNGKFKSCPTTPNCVSTQADSNDQQHYISPLTYNTTKDEVMKKLVEIINSLERTKIIEQTDNYLHVEFTSKIMKYVDDVEFYIDDENKIIHFRSASRVGYSDLGVNRKRMEEIVQLFNE